MKKVYIAGPFEERVKYRELADKIETLGYEVVSRWIHEPPEHDELSDMIGHPNAPGFKMEHIALDDMEDLDRADILVLMQGSSRGGRHWETGYFYGLGRNIPPHFSEAGLCWKPRSVVVVGEPEIIFHYLPGVTRVSSEERLLNFLKERKKIEKERLRILRAVWDAGEMPSLDDVAKALRVKMSDHD